LLHIIQLSLLLFTLLLLVGCNPSSYNASDAPNNKISGVVVDGYISGATVCLDFNYNNSCDKDEPVTSTDANGSYSFTNFNLKQENTIISVLAYGGIDTATNKKFKGQIRNAIEFSKKEQKKDIVISPLTDLVVTHFFTTYERGVQELHDAQEVVSSSFEIDKELLSSDPMKSVKLFSVNQKVHHTEALLQTLVEKNLLHYKKSSSRLSIQTLVKEEILHFGYDIDTILITLENTINIQLPENEKVFVTKQTKELQSNLTELTNNTNLSISTLPALQKRLFNSQYEANDRLYIVDGSYPIEIVPINLEVSKKSNKL